MDVTLAGIVTERKALPLKASDSIVLVEFGKAADKRYIHPENAPEDTVVVPAAKEIPVLPCGQSKSCVPFAV